MIRQDIIDNLNNAFREIRKQFDNLTPILEIISALIDRAITANFDAHGRWDGNATNIELFSGGSQKWKPLAESTKKRYQELGWDLEPTLNRNKRLISTIEVRPYDKASIIISVNSPYGAIHNYGGIINSTIPITQKMRNFFWYKYSSTKDPAWKAMALTRKKTFQRLIKIPPRPYITLTETDLEEIISIITTYIAK